MRPIDYIIGSIQNLNDDSRAGWQAFYRKDAECDQLRLEIKKLKATISRLRTKK
jgi:hypothetical protein